MRLAKSYDFDWAVLALIIFTFVVGWLNTYPVRFKERVMGGYGAGNLRANPYIFKLAT